MKKLFISVQEVIIIVGERIKFEYTFEAELVGLRNRTGP